MNDNLCYMISHDNKCVYQPTNKLVKIDMISCFSEFLKSQRDINSNMNWL